MDRTMFARLDKICTYLSTVIILKFAFDERDYKIV